MNILISYTRALIGSILSSLSRVLSSVGLYIKLYLRSGCSIANNSGYLSICFLISSERSSTLLFFIQLTSSRCLRMLLLSLSFLSIYILWSGWSSLLVSTFASSLNGEVNFMSNLLSYSRSWNGLCD